MQPSVTSLPTSINRVGGYLASMLSRFWTLFYGFWNREKSSSHRDGISCGLSTTNYTVKSYFFVDIVLAGTLLYLVVEDRRE